MSTQNRTRSSLLGIWEDLLLTVFVLFYRIARGQWWPAANAHKGVAGVTIVEGCLCIVALGWVEVALGHRFQISEWIIGAALLVLALANFYFLIDRKRGLNFELQFDDLSRSKRLFLRSGAIGLIVTTFGLMFWSVEIYHRVFGIVPPTS